MDELSRRLLVALEVSQRGESEAALVLFAELLRDFPESFEGHFLHAAELASFGQYDLAVASYDKALNLNPEHAICRFQYALLLLTLGKEVECNKVIAPLINLPEAHYLNRFAHALALISQHRPLEAEAPLRQGLASNAEQPDLNRDMTLILQRVLAFANAQQVEQSAEIHRPMLDSAVGLPAEILVRAYSKRSH